MEAVSNTEKGKANQELLRRKGRVGGGQRKGERRGEEKGWNEEGRSEKQEMPRRHEMLSMEMYYMTQDSHCAQSLKCSVTGHGDFAVHFPAQHAGVTWYLQGSLRALFQQS